MKRIKIAIIVLAAVVLVSIGIFFIANYFNNLSIKKAEEEEQKLVMFDFDKESVEKIEINNKDGVFITEYDKENGWTLTNDDQIVFNESYPNSICANMANLKATKILTNTDKSTYGLDNPTKVTAYSGDKTYTVFIGDPNPTYESYYAMKENDPNIYLIDFSNGEILSPSKDDLKYTAIYPYSTYKVTNFTLWRGKENDNNILFSIGQDSDGAWILEKPVLKTPARSINVSEFLTLSSRDEIYSFVQENCTEADYAKYGFDDPCYVFEISTADDTTKLIFGDYTEDGSEIYGLFPESGQVVTFLPNSMTLLNYKTSDMINTVIFSTDISNVVTVEVKLPDANAVLSKSGSPAEYFVNDIKVGRDEFLAFYDSFNNAYTDANKTNGEPSGEAEIVIEYTQTNNVVSRVKYIPVPNSDKYWVMADTSYTGYTVSKETVEKIISSYKELEKSINAGVL